MTNLTPARVRIVRADAALADLVRSLPDDAAERVAADAAELLASAAEAVDAADR